jgi:hypothetical protein
MRTRAGGPTQLGTMSLANDKDTYLAYRTTLLDAVSRATLRIVSEALRPPEEIEGYCLQ